MITIRYPDGRHSHLDDKFLPNVCLDMTGGGRTPDETYNAMALQDLLVRKGRAEIKGVVIHFQQGGSV